MQTINNQANNERAALAADDIEINKNDEFFISVAKKGIHSFVMLGVMQNQKPTLLARVGKTNNVDPSFKTDKNGNPTAASNCKLAVKQVFMHAKSDMQSEPLKLRDAVSYAAYAITYVQYLRFTKLARLTAQAHTIQFYHLPTKMTLPPY